MSAEEIESLESSLHQYEAQLRQVTEAISGSASGPEKDTLVSLRDDIQQLINLTSENLSQLGNPKEDASISQNVAPLADDDYDDPFAREFALFKAEIEQVEKKHGNSDNTEASVKEEIPFADIQAELKALQGMKCQAPFIQAWGTAYHNALVFHVEPAESITEMQQIQVRVMFTNPTDSKMVPCNYYLDGECRFDDRKCRFSHGALVHLSDLKEYKEPNFKSVKPGSGVLVRSEKDKLWHRAIVQHEIKDGIWEVRMESAGGAKVQVALKDLLPLQGDNEDGEDRNASDNSDDDDANEEDEDEDDEGNNEDKEAVVLLSLSNAPSSALGSWEKHTKGIGSRLMERMGYVVGSGLGPNGEGRVEPVEAVVFPQGKSLDHCMRLKAEAGGDSLLKTEKKLRRLKRKQEAQQNAKYEREKKRVNVFDFLNSKLGGNKLPNESTSNNSSSSRGNKSVLKGESSKGLNVASLQVGEDIKRAQKDLSHLRESLNRQRVGTPAYSAIASKVAGKERDIRHLQESEQRINAEQNQRKGNKKMAVF